MNYSQILAPWKISVYLFLDTTSTLSISILVQTKHAITNRDYYIFLGSLDCSIKLWDFNAITEEANGEETGTNNTVQKEDKFLLQSFSTKNSPIKGLHFTRRNLLLAVGSYEGSS